MLSNNMLKRRGASRAWCLKGSGEMVSKADEAEGGIYRRWMRVRGRECRSRCYGNPTTPDENRVALVVLAR